MVIHFIPGRRYWDVSGYNSAGNAAANVMVARMMLLLLLLDCMGVLWVVEQPAGSLMQVHARFESLIETRCVYRHSLHMKDFGAASSKPTWLYSNKPWISDISALAPPLGSPHATHQLVDSWRDPGSGKLRCQGNSRTKSSQSYPEGFGIAFAELTSLHASDIYKSSRRAERRAKSKSLPSVKCDDAWIDANLSPVLALLAR